jgi:hypothetical protein
MKLNQAIVRPDNMNDVLESLNRAEVCGLTVSRELGHGVGGIVGALLTGVLADPAWGAGRGLVHGHASQLGLQALGVAAALAYSAAATWALLRAIALVTRLEATPRAQGVGMDVTQHGEEAYGSGEGAVLLTSDRAPTAVGAAGLETARA